MLYVGFCAENAPGHVMTAVHVRPPVTPQVRKAAVRRARALNRLTIGWNVVEGIVAITAGIVAGSVSLIGFGLDSGIEVSASLILAWRLSQERRGGCMAENDRRATRAIAVSFAALAVYVTIHATTDLLTAAEPSASPVGLILTTTSALLMPVLARAKARLAPALGSQAAKAESNQTRLCAVLSVIVLAGLALNAVAGWWWADPAAALAIGAIATVEAVRTWNAKGLADTCCG
jgi:divalent metal cation (Fe/Co/Zn/Cd) transporter